MLLGLLLVLLLVTLSLASSSDPTSHQRLYESMLYLTQLAEQLDKASLVLQHRYKGALSSECTFTSTDLSGHAADSWRTLQVLSMYTSASNATHTFIAEVRGCLTSNSIEAAEQDAQIFLELVEGLDRVFRRMTLLREYESFPESFRAPHGQ